MEATTQEMEAATQESVVQKLLYSVPRSTGSASKSAYKSIETVFQYICDAFISSKNISVRSCKFAAGICIWCNRKLFGDTYYETLLEDYLKIKPIQIEFEVNKKIEVWTSSKQLSFPPSRSKITKIEWWDETLFDNPLLSLNSPLRKIGSAIGRPLTAAVNGAYKRQEFQGSNWQHEFIIVYFYRLGSDQENQKEGIISLDWYDESKVQIRFNDDVLLGRRDHAIKKNNFADSRLGQLFQTNKVRGDMLDLIYDTCQFTKSNKYDVVSCNCQHFCSTIWERITDFRD